MDVTNPGLVAVANETYGNPDPNGGRAFAIPRELDALIAAAGYGYPPPADAGAEASVFPTPEQVFPDEEPVFVPPPRVDFPPPFPNVDVSAQSIGQGSMQPVDPGNPAAGYAFVEPADFIVVGPADSFQTNAIDETQTSATITAVLDADNLPHAADASTTRYYLVLGPPDLTSYPVSLLGRQIIFADDTLTAADAGASRFIQSYGRNFMVINRDDPLNPDFPTLTLPAAGDVIQFDVNRQGSEQVNTSGGTTDVFIAPPPPVNVPNVVPTFGSLGNVAITTGAAPIITSGQIVPTSRFVSVPDECQVVGLPKNVFV